MPAARRRLSTIRHFLNLELAAGLDQPGEMRKRTKSGGDHWDAFTCAFAACCEDHGAGHLHGWSNDGAANARLRKEGAILTIE